MQDRQPGAPGQYKAVIDAAELQKMQAGEQFVITMTRDDQPLVEGTPYNKAAVLPDDLAAIICPGVLDPTPADAFRGVAAQKKTVSLLAASWVGDTTPYTQTVAVDGILATDNPHYGIVYAADQETRLAQKEAFALVDDLETAEDTVTFTCFEDKPAVDLEIQMEVNR